MSPPLTPSTCQAPVSQIPTVTPPHYKHPGGPALTLPPPVPGLPLSVSFLSNSPQGHQTLRDAGVSLMGVSCQWVRWQVRVARWLSPVALARASPSNQVPGSRCWWAHDSGCCHLLFLVDCELLQMGHRLAHLAVVCSDH